MYWFSNLHNEKSIVIGRIKGNETVPAKKIVVLQNIKETVLQYNNSSRGMFPPVYYDSKKAMAIDANFIYC